MINITLPILESVDIKSLHFSTKDKKNNNEIILRILKDRLPISILGTEYRIRKNKQGKMIQ